jgi:hypothetical protein
MMDMLVKLYELENDWRFLEEQEKIGITIRKPIGPEKHLILDWVRGQFFDAWASETDIAISNSPKTCFVAIKESQLAGFACYDATALGYFGPLGVAESNRGIGTGVALLRACLLDMKLKGYGYTIIPTDHIDFYRNAVGAVLIPDSSPGIYKTWLTRDQEE